MPSSLIDALAQNRAADVDVPAALTDRDQHGLLEALSAVPDPRDPRGVRYSLTSLLAVAVCAVLAGATTFAAIADWACDLDPPARRKPGFTAAIPAGTTVWRILVRLDPDVLSAILTGWLRNRTPPAADATSRRPRRMVIGRRQGPAWSTPARRAPDPPAVGLRHHHGHRPDPGPHRHQVQRDPSPHPAAGSGTNHGRRTDRSRDRR
jgi:hypothetical protein